MFVFNNAVSEANGLLMVWSLHGSDALRRELLRMSTLQAGIGKLDGEPNGYLCWTTVKRLVVSRS